MLGISWKAASPQQGRAGQGPGAGCAPGGTGSPPAWQGRSKAVTVALSPWCGSPLGTRLLDVLSTEMPGAGHCRLVPGNCWGLGSRCHAAQPGSSAQVTVRHEQSTSGPLGAGCLKREEASCGMSGVCPVLFCCWS